MGTEYYLRLKRGSRARGKSRMRERGRKIKVEIGHARRSSKQEIGPKEMRRQNPRRSRRKGVNDAQYRHINFLGVRNSQISLNSKLECKGKILVRLGRTEGAESQNEEKGENGT